MKKNVFKKMCVILIATILVSVCLPGMAANPGSNEDPLVSLSYVNEVLMPQLRSYVDSKATASSGTFKLVEVKKGQTVIGSMSTQFILRTGSATAVATAKGGIADVTAGRDLPLYTPIPLNHLLIVPYEDWRGVEMVTDGILLINGPYSFH